MINLIPKYFITKQSTYKIVYDDKMAFMCLIIEVLTGNFMENYVSLIDFNERKLNNYLITELNDPFFVEIIESCLLNESHSAEEFFSEENTTFATISKAIPKQLSVMEIGDFDLKNLDRSGFKLFTSVLQPVNYLQTLACTDYDELCDDHTDILVNTLLRRTSS